MIHGEKLFEAEQRDSNYYVVRTGAVQIVDDDGDEPKVRAGQRSASRR